MIGRAGPLLERLRWSPLAHNTAALYGVHFATLILPLVTIPYLARVLRPDGWGLVVFAQSLAAWLALVLEYGFQLSATRMIAQVRGDRRRVAEVVAGVLGARCILVLVLTAAAAAAYLAIPTFRLQPHFLFWAWLLAVAQGLSPFWYFQGVERMKAAAALEVTAKVGATIGIFMFVRQPADGWMVLALQAVAGFAWVGVATYWIYREVPFVRLRLSEAIAMLRHGATLFAFKGTSGLYMHLNPFILGLFTSASTVAFFGGAERLVRAAIGLIQPVSQALYPRLSNLVSSDPAAAGRLLRASLVVIGGLGLVIGVVTALGAPLIVRVLLGPGYEAAIPVLRMLAVLPPIVALATVIGIQWALPMGYDQSLFTFVAGAGALNVLAAIILVPRFGATGMAAAVIMAESAVVVGLLWLVWRYGAGVWRGVGEGGANC